MKHGMPMGVALIVGLMLCSTAPSRAEGPCVDKIVQRSGSVRDATCVTPAHRMATVPASGCTTALLSAT
jgi:hypothetical protein